MSGVGFIVSRKVLFLSIGIFWSGIFSKYVWGGCRVTDVTLVGGSRGGGCRKGVFV